MRGQNILLKTYSLDFGDIGPVMWKELRCYIYIFTSYFFACGKVIFVLKVKTSFYKKR